MQKRTRDKSLTLRLTEDELAYFHKKMDTAKYKTQADFFMAVLRKKSIIVIEDLRPLLQELKRHGNNLNQVSRQLNSSIFDEGAKTVLNECWTTYRNLSKLGDEIKNATSQSVCPQSRTEESN